jgi:hypothetical protein
VLDKVANRIAETDAKVDRLARELVARIRCLTVDIAELTKELTAIVCSRGPRCSGSPAAES